MLDQGHGDGWTELLGREMARKNPIERRVDILHDQWTEFAENPDARLLAWQAHADETALIDAFYAKEIDEQATETPDVFLCLRTAFAHPSAHGYALRQELIDQYEAAKPGLERDGLDNSWQCPFAKGNDTDLHSLVRALVSFREHQGDDVGLLAVWLDADEVNDPQSYLLWLQRLIHETPAEIRFFVVAGRTDDAFVQLHAAEPVLVVAQPCDLDMPSALQELAQQAGTDTPGGQFRQLLVKLGTLLGQGDLGGALPLAQAAGMIATAQGWPHLAALVQMTLATGYTALARHLDAVQCYAEAERLGAESEQALTSNDQKEQDDQEGSRPYATRIRLQARFGQGAALIAHGAWAHAAQAYQQALPLAEALADLRAQLDCLRLASLCQERSGQLKHAWDLGMRGFSLGATMDDETRKSSTLPYLCEQLERLTAHADYAAHRAPLLQHCEQLLGPDWRPSSKGAA